MNEELEYWRSVLAGQAGFNGHPQALVRLMEVSDEANLRRLAQGYPEAVAALRETRERASDRPGGLGQ